MKRVDSFPYSIKNSGLFYALYGGSSIIPLKGRFFVSWDIKKINCSNHLVYYPNYRWHFFRSTCKLIINIYNLKISVAKDICVDDGMLPMTK